MDWIGWIITTVIMEVRSVIGAWGSLVREQRTVRDSLGLVLLLKHEEPENIHHRIATFVIDDSRLCLNPTSQSGESCPFPLRFVASFALVLVSSLSNTPSLVPHLILASRQQVASSRQQAAGSRQQASRIFPLPKMTTSQPKPLPFYAQFTAGAIAGVTELLCLYPLDVVKTRMQLQGKAVAGSAPGEHYNGMVDAFRKIIASEG